MKVLEEGDPLRLAEPIDPLAARLLRRYTHALGIIDTRQTQERHNKLVGWLESRFPVANQLMQRCRLDDGQPLQPGQMVYSKSFWHSGQIAGQTNLFSNHGDPNIPYAKETSPTNFDSSRPATPGLPIVSETLVDSHALLDQDDTDHSQQEPVAAVWRLRRAASIVSSATTEAPDNPRVPTPTKATTVERKASNNQTHRADLSIAQANNPLIHSDKPLTIAKTKLGLAAMPPSKTLSEGNQGESLAYPLTQSNAAKKSKSSAVSISHPSKHSKTARTRELTSPEITKPDLFVAQSPKSNPKVGGNALIKPGLPQGNSEPLNNLSTENHRENSVPTNKPATNEVITPETQTISPRFTKKEWVQLIESVSKVIGDKLLADLDRRGIRLWR